MFVRGMAKTSKGPVRTFFKKSAEKFEKAADAYREVSVLSGKHFFDGNELAAILFSTKTAAKMHGLLGSPKYGTVATIASIVLEREIKPDDVRQWCVRAFQGNAERKRRQPIVNT